MSDNLLMDVPMGYHLLIPYPTGVYWDTQAGGLACSNPGVEGFLLPLGEPRSSIPHGPGCWGSLKAWKHEISPVERAGFEEIDRWLKGQGWGMEFDWERADLAEEAWWPVLLSRRVGNLRDKRAWLATDNCD